MRIFKCMFADCPMASDAYPHEECFNGAALRFKAKFITKKDDYAGLPEGEGGNDDGGEGETVIDVVDSYNLHTVEGYKVKEWLALVKPLMKKIMGVVNEKGIDADSLKDYKKGCVEFVNFIKGKFDEIQIYQGDIGEYEGVEQSFGYALNEDENDPLSLSIYYFKDTLIDEKY